MTQLEIRLLGSPQIEYDGEPIEVDTRKATAMLAYLAVMGETYTRDALAALLWPDYDQSSARGALRRTLSVLRKALDKDCLEVTRATIGIRPDVEVNLDVEQFQRYLKECEQHGHGSEESCPRCIPPLEKAVSLYRGDFLSGFTLRDSANFDEWQFFQTDARKRDLEIALEKLVESYSKQGAFDDAIAHAYRWLAQDPLREEVHRELMRLYAWKGQRSAALRQYRECVRILEQELGVAPLEETTQLYQNIQENKIPEKRVPADSQQYEIQKRHKKPGDIFSTRGNGLHFPTFTHSVPLVGRSGELENMVRIYQGIRTDGYFLVVSGEVGVGKTRLVEEFLGYVRARGGMTVTANCYEGESDLAYGPFMEGLRIALDQGGTIERLEGISPHWLMEAARMLPQLSNFFPGSAIVPSSALEGPGAQTRFFESIRQLLLGICKGESTGVIFVDDIHWGDAASQDLLTYLVRRLNGYPVLILVTWRDEDMDGSHRLHQLVSESQRLSRGSLLPLKRLSYEHMVELVHSSAPADTEISEEWQARLFQETEGLPFFVVEYLAEGAKTSLEDWSIPQTVRDLLRARISTVSETGWQLLTAAAVIGRSFDLETLREASGRSETETVQELERLLNAGLISERSHGEEIGRTNVPRILFDFNHEQLRAVVYEETSLARKRLLHRRVADALVNQLYNRREYGVMASQLAHHYRLAGEESKAAQFFKVAGEYARGLYANKEALSHFQTALALNHPETALIYEEMGDLQTLMGDYDAARNNYEAAAALTNADSSARLEGKLGELYHRIGEWQLAETHFRAAEEKLGESGDAGERARLYTYWSRTAHHKGESERAIQLARQSLELAENQQDPRALVRVHNVLGILARSQGKIDEATSHLEQSLAIAEKLDDIEARVAALNNLALVYGEDDKLDQAIETVKTALELCVRQGDRHREAALHNNLADLLHADGRSEEAMEHLKKAVVIFSEIGEEAGKPTQPEIWKLTEW